MLGLSDARHFRRLVAGFCMIAAPLVLLAGAILHPQSKEDAAAHLAVVGDDPDRYYAAHALLLVGLALFLPAVLGLMHLLRRRATALGHVGGGLAMIGLFGAASVVAVDAIAVTQMGRADGDAAEMAELLDRIKESTGFRAIAVVGALAWLFGMLLLAYGLARARAAPAWMAGGIAVAAIIVFAGQVSDNRIIFAVAFAIYLASLGLLGGRILAESDEAWEVERAHAPLPTRPTVAS